MVASPASPPGTVLVRDIKSLAFKLGAGIVLLGLATGCGVLATHYGFMAGLGAAIFGVAGLSLTVTAFRFTGRGPCPSCGKEMSDVPAETDGARCAHCGAYALVRASTMTVTPETAVAREPIYEIEIEPGAQPAFPELCVGCGAPAVKTLPWELKKEIGGVPGIARTARKWSIDVPFCERHGAPGPLGLPTGIHSFEHKITIQSYLVWLRTTGRAQ